MIDGMQWYEKNVKDVQTVMVKKIPALYNEKKKCTGCTACYSICPVSRNGDRRAIFMQTDEEGFEYPVIDEKNCICCYLCCKVCPLNND